MEGELDLYADLEDPFFPVDPEISSDHLGEVTDASRQLLAELEELRHFNTQLSSQNTALKKNISCLYKTARLELTRRESVIDSLKQRIKTLEAVINHLSRVKTNGQCGGLATSGGPNAQPVGKGCIKHDSSRTDVQHPVNATQLGGLSQDKTGACLAAPVTQEDDEKGEREISPMTSQLVAPERRENAKGGGSKPTQPQVKESPWERENGRMAGIGSSRGSSVSVTAWKNQGKSSADGRENHERSPSVSIGKENRPSSHKIPRNRPTSQMHGRARSERSHSKGENKVVRPCRVERSERHSIKPPQKRSRSPDHREVGRFKRARSVASREEEVDRRETEYRSRNVSSEANQTEQNDVGAPNLLSSNFSRALQGGKDPSSEILASKQGSRSTDVDIEGRYGIANVSDISNEHNCQKELENGEVYAMFVVNQGDAESETTLALSLEDSSVLDSMPAISSVQETQQQSPPSVTSEDTVEGTGNDHLVMELRMPSTSRNDCNPLRENLSHSENPEFESISDDEANSAGSSVTPCEILQDANCLEKLPTSLPACSHKANIDENFPASPTIDTASPTANKEGGLEDGEIISDSENENSSQARTNSTRSNSEAPTRPRTKYSSGRQCGTAHTSSNCKVQQKKPTESSRERDCLRTPTESSRQRNSLRIPTESSRVRDSLRMPHSRPVHHSVQHRSRQSSRSSRPPDSARQRERHHRTREPLPAARPTARWHSSREHGRHPLPHSQLL